MAAGERTVLQFNASSTASLRRRFIRSSYLASAIVTYGIELSRLELVNFVPNSKIFENMIWLLWISNTIIICIQLGMESQAGSALIHDFYSREVPNPVHLTADTGFRNGEGTVKAYVSVNLALGDRQLAAQFQEIPLDLHTVEAERVGFDILKTTAVDKLPNDLEGMEVTMQRLSTLIDDVYKYVDHVVERRVPADNNIGRFIRDTVSSLPKLSPPAFDKLMNGSLQSRVVEIAD
ncbi:Eukaryotic translation initiation factor 3 subunit F [Hibiscus syriacus]|uniref:Eukaryotic translation initiation factor 3 subunit F n=1 Tax=Hibiscus syriacus TaxID=106335 RepID=A0A6A2YCG9_HIBSY|nr:Eukaryotic translation initiation factor 3 subunit F [Hibiscus syriacus]